MNRFFHFLGLLTALIISFSWNSSAHARNFHDRNPQDIYRGASKVYPVDRPIVVHTVPGRIYTHVEGSNPQWKLGVIKNIKNKHAPIPGDGTMLTFTPSLKRGFHLVEESISTGLLNIHLVGKFQKSFRYSIRQGNITVAEGEVAQDELMRTPPIPLPFGVYTFQAVSKGYATPNPIPFSISEETSPLNLDFLLERYQARVRILTKPEHLTQNLKGIIRRIDPEKQKVLWKRLIPLNGQYMNVDEGEYTIEFPEIEGFTGPSESNILGRFQLTAKDSPSDIFAEYTPAQGMLTVSYQTGPERTRLDRVRFWLIDEENNRTLYPKRSQRVDFNPHARVREVVIEDLKPGIYNIDFLVPNADKLFSNVPTQEVVIKKGIHTELNQFILPHYSSINIQPKILTSKNDVDIASGKPVPLPLVKIFDGRNKLITSSSSKNVLAENLLPGDYTITFGEIDGFSTPEPISLSLTAGEQIGPLSGTYKEKSVSLSIASNMADKAWELKHKDTIIASDRGSAGPFMLPAGVEYTLNTEPMERYSVDLSTGASFSLDPGTNVTASIEYTPKYGGFNITGDIALLPDDTATITLIPSDMAPHITRKFTSDSGKLFWEEDDFPIGEYTVEYGLPNYYAPHPSQTLQVHKGKVAKLHPEFYGSRTIHITTNNQEALFSLYDPNGALISEGEGENYSFANLLPGTYSLSFYPTNSSQLVPPIDRAVELEGNHNVTINARYHLKSYLSLSSNMNDFTVTITPITAEGEPYTRTIAKRNITFPLPTGKYRIDFHPLTGEMKKRYGENHPDPIEFVLKEGSTENIHAIYEANRGDLIVTTNLDDASYTVCDISDGTPLVIGTFKGRHSVIPLTFVGKYKVIFEEVFSYNTPQSLVVDVKADKKEIVGVEYTPRLNLATIPAGPTIVGDTFGEGSKEERPSRIVDLDSYTIAINPVTNEQFASWLSRAIREGKIKYLMEKGVRGQVVDQMGRLLFETIDADSDSMISATLTDEFYSFASIKDKEDHPVIEVSWYGANAYCKDNGYRLPTEAEWENAAGMTPHTPDQPLKKFRFGNGQNMIDHTMANFTRHYEVGKTYSVNTRPVGFFNGLNLLQSDDDTEKALYRDNSLIATRYGTNVAVSPYGLNDMSGNVREWVSDWFSNSYYQDIETRNPQGPGHGSQKVTKGGSYNSIKYELRVSSRIPLTPENTDAFTGFRVVLDEKKAR